jgi:hypothetical protein
MIKETNTCSTCHWWTKVLGEDKDGRRICVWHTGLREDRNAKVVFGGNKSLRTTAEFGCVDWEVDTRVKS